MRARSAQPSKLCWSKRQRRYAVASARSSTSPSLTYECFDSANRVRDGTHRGIDPFSMVNMTESEMHAAFLRLALALGVGLGANGAIAQQSPSNNSVVKSPTSSGSTSANSGVTDKTSNTNTMNSQGTTSQGAPGTTSGTVGSSNVPQSSRTGRNPRGSGASTSGGIDYNGDNGADRMKR